MQKAHYSAIAMEAGYRHVANEGIEGDNIACRQLCFLQKKNWASLFLESACIDTQRAAMIATYLTVTLLRPLSLSPLHPFHCLVKPFVIRGLCIT